MYLYPVYSQDIRSKNEFRTRYLRLTPSGNSVTYYGINFFNMLPDILKSLSNNKIKNVIKYLPITEPIEKTYNFDSFDSVVWKN